MKIKARGMISMTMTIDDLFNYSNEYSASYLIMEDKGRINFRDKHIWINPCFNEEGMTYIHEMMHHHYDFMNGEHLSESMIESLAEDFYSEHSLLCEKLARSKLYPEKLKGDIDWD